MHVSEQSKSLPPIQPPPHCTMSRDLALIRFAPLSVPLMCHVTRIQLYDIAVGTVCKNSVVILHCTMLHVCVCAQCVWVCGFGYAAVAVE